MLLHKVSMKLKPFLGYRNGTEGEENHKETLLLRVCERRDVYSLFICSGGKSSALCEGSLLVRLNALRALLKHCQVCQQREKKSGQTALN